MKATKHAPVLDLNYHFQRMEFSELIFEKTAAATILTSELGVHHWVRGMFHHLSSPSLNTNGTWWNSAFLVSCRLVRMECNLAVSECLNYISYSHLTTWVSLWVLKFKRINHWMIHPNYLDTPDVIMMVPAAVDPGEFCLILKDINIFWGMDRAI